MECATERNRGLEFAAVDSDEAATVLFKDLRRRLNERFRGFGSRKTSQSSCSRRFGKLSVDKVGTVPLHTIYLQSCQQIWRLFSF